MLEPIQKVLPKGKSGGFVEQIGPGRQKKGGKRKVHSQNKANHRPIKWTAIVDGTRLTEIKTDFDNCVKVECHEGDFEAAKRRANHKLLVSFHHALTFALTRQLYK
jgi:hypothetical protein